MVWLAWHRQQRHPGFLRRTASFPVVAPDARRRQVVPLIGSSPGSRNDVVDGKRGLLCAAVLTGEVVAAKNVLARQFDLFERHPQVGAQPDHAREGVGLPTGAHGQGCALLHKFGLGEKQQQECLLRRTDADWLVGLVED